MEMHSHSTVNILLFVVHLLVVEGRYKVLPANQPRQLTVVVSNYSQVCRGRIAPCIILSFPSASSF